MKGSTIHNNGKYIKHAAYFGDATSNIKNFSHANYNTFNYELFVVLIDIKGTQVTQPATLAKVMALKQTAL